MMFREKTYNNEQIIMYSIQEASASHDYSDFSEPCELSTDATTTSYPAALFRRDFSDLGTEYLYDP